MSAPVFYRTVLNRKLDPGARVLFRSLLERNERIDELHRGYHGRIQALHARDGNAEIEPSDEERAEETEYDLQAEELRKNIQLLVTLIESEEFLLRAALDSERTALEYEREIYDSNDPEEAALGRPMLELREANVHEAESFHANRAPIELDLPFSFE